MNEIQIPITMNIEIPKFESTLFIHDDDGIICQFPKPKPNWWWRFWYWALLGWKWKDIDESQE